MNNRSWMIVPEQDPRFRLADKLRARDVFGGRDCGYVEQMRPFIREFSQPGDIVFDPFCGFATTLLAAELEGRLGLGTEADVSRAALAQERLSDHGCQQQRVIANSCLEFVSQLPMVDLILTSVPYFGCRWPNERSTAQLYASETYADFLESMRRIFVALKPKLSPGGFIICMAENVRLGTHFIPLAWDVARMLSERFAMCDERILVYEREGIEVAAPAITTNRSHEYALIARNEPRAIAIESTTSILREFVAAFPAAIVYGSFAAALTKSSAIAPGDADILVPHDMDLIGRMASWLERRDFRLTRWGAPLNAITTAAAARDSYYIRAERLTKSGELVLVDLSFEPGDGTLLAAREIVRTVDGLPVASID